MSNIKLKEELDKIYPHSKGCIEGRKQLRENFKMYHPRECVEPERLAIIDQLLSLFNSHMVENLKEIIGHDEKLPYVTFSPSLRKRTEYIVRNEFRRFLREKVKEMGK